MDKLDKLKELQRRQADEDDDRERERQIADAMRGLREKDEVVARVAFIYENDIQAARVVIPGLGLRECLLDPLFPVLPEQEIVVEPLHDNLGRYRYVRHAYYHGENDWFSDLDSGKIPDINTPSGPLPGIRLPNFGDLLELLWVKAQGGTTPPITTNAAELLTIQKKGDPQKYEWFLRPKDEYRKILVGSLDTPNEDNPQMSGHRQTSYSNPDLPETYGLVAWNSDRFRTKYMLRFADAWVKIKNEGIRCAGTNGHSDRADFYEGATTGTPNDGPDIAGTATIIPRNKYTNGIAIVRQKRTAQEELLCGENSNGGLFAIGSPWRLSDSYGVELLGSFSRNRGYGAIFALAQAPIEILGGAAGVFALALYDDTVMVGTSDNFFSIGRPTGPGDSSGNWTTVGQIPTVAVPAGAVSTGMIRLKVTMTTGDEGNIKMEVWETLYDIETTSLYEVHAADQQVDWQNKYPMGGSLIDSTSGYVFGSLTYAMLDNITFYADEAIVRHYPLIFEPAGLAEAPEDHPGYPGEYGWTQVIKPNPLSQNDTTQPKYKADNKIWINFPYVDPDSGDPDWSDPTKTKWYYLPLQEHDFAESHAASYVEDLWNIQPPVDKISHNALSDLFDDDHTQYLTEDRVMALLKTVSVTYFIQPDTAEDAKIDPTLDTKGTGPGPEWPLEEYTYLGGFSGHQIITAYRYDRTPPDDASVVAYNADNTREWIPVVDRRGDTMTGPLIAPDPQSSTDRLIIAQRLTPLPTPTVLYDHSGHERNGTILGGEYAVWQKPSLLTGAGPDAASVLLNGQTYFLVPALNGLVTYTIEIHFAWFSTGISPGGLLGTPNHYLGVSSAGMDDDLHEPYPGPFGGSGYFTYSTFGNPVEHDGQPDPPPDGYPYVGELRPMFGGGDSIVIPHNMIAIVANGVDSFRTFQLSTLRGGAKRMVEAPGYTPAALTNMAFGAIYNGTGKMSGYLSEIIVWDRALSGNEVYGNYNYGSFTTGTQWEDRIRESSPYAWYRFQEGTREAIEGEIEFDTNYLYTRPVAPDVANGYRKVFTAPIEGVVTPGRYPNPVITLNDTGNVIGIETSTDFVGDDDFTAQLDGETWTFQTSDFFEPGSLEVVYNGLELRPLIDFTEWRTRDGFDLDINIPTVGDSLYVRYTIGTGNDAALGITPTVSYGYPQGAADLSELTDGDDTSYGALPSTLPGAMQLDLGSQKTIFRLRLYGGDVPRRPKRGSILYSTDGTTWITLVDYDGVTANERIYEVPFIKARYWRVIVTDLDDVGNSIRWHTWSIYAVDE